MARDIETSTRGRGTTGTGYGARRRGAQQLFFLRIWGALRSRNECARLGLYRPMGGPAPHRDIVQIPRGAAMGGEIKAPHILKKKNCCEHPRARNGDRARWNYTEVRAISIDIAISLDPRSSASLCGRLHIYPIVSSRQRCTSAAALPLHISAALRAIGGGCAADIGGAFGADKPPIGGEFYAAVWCAAVVCCGGVIEPLEPPMAATCQQRPWCDVWCVVWSVVQSLKLLKCIGVSIYNISILRYLCGVCNP